MRILRSTLWWLTCGAVVIGLGIPLALLSIPDPQRRPISWGAYVWSCILMKVAGCTLEVEGKENIEGLTQFVLVSNHQSYFDIFALCCIVKGAPHFLAKKELFRIPIFGQLLSLARVLKIDRQNPDLAVKTIKESLEKGIIRRPIAIFPEGTRSPTGELQPFRKKGLNILMETGIPLVPMAMKGTRDAMPKGRYTVSPARIRVKIGKPLVPGPGLSDEEKDQIRQRLWEWIHSYLATL
jgi:1-acyl-sn-glycerol-3-phosphate acyltransferase